MSTSDLPPPSTERVDDLADPEAAATTSSASLVAIDFDEPLKAQEALLAAMRLQTHGRLTLEDAAIVTRAPNGKVRVIQTKDINPLQGATSGSWWGLLAGLFVGGPLIGAALGAGLGGLFAKLRDIGIDDDEMKELGEQLTEGHAALFLLIEDCHQIHALGEARRFDGTLLHSTLDSDMRDKLVEALAVPTGAWV